MRIYCNFNNCLILSLDILGLSKEYYGNCFYFQFFQALHLSRFQFTTEVDLGKGEFLLLVGKKVTKLHLPRIFKRENKKKGHQSEKCLHPLPMGNFGIFEKSLTISKISGFPPRSESTTGSLSFK